MSEYKNIEFQIKQYQMLEAKGELTEYAQGKLNGMLEVMNIAENNEVLDLVSGCFSFAKHFKQNYEFHQYTTEGKEIYITDTGVVRTEYEVMEHWKTYYR